jgi:RNA polymerase sigma factor (sigma-70 family)
MTDARERCIEEFRAMVGRCAERLLATARGYLDDPHQAEDVVQTAFMKVWEHWNDADVQSRLEPWLIRVVRNRCVDILRERGRMERREKIREAAQPHQTHVQEVGPGVPDPATVQSGLRRLKEPYRTALLLRFSEKLSYEQISHRLDAPLGTVKSWIARGLQILRKLLDEGRRHDV